MGFESEKESSRLPLFSSLHAHMVSPERPMTPPSRASASVPFLWEEKPGKPKACAAAMVTPFSDDFTGKCLELPPRLVLLQDGNNNKKKSSKLYLPTTVFDGPYMGRARFQSSSFRMVKSERYVFPSYGDKGEEYSSSSNVSITRLKKSGSLNSRSHSKSHFWASIYEGLKQVVPWSKRERKNRCLGADFLIKPPYH